VLLDKVTLKTWLDFLGILDCARDPLVGIVNDPALTLSDDLIAVLRRSKLISPFLECSFSELHNVALVDDCQTATLLSESVVDGSLDETGGSLLGDGLDTIA
jgi:hypothetical protein